MAEPVEVRIFGLLHEMRRQQGLPTTCTVEIPEEGTTGTQLAIDMGLPPEKIEGIFVNRTVYALDHPVMPGDRVAFVPYGTPGPHRFFLGLYKASHDRQD
jgi:molybdopterin converting factor small subunit